jgi:hypothetical protein
MFTILILTSLSKPMQSADSKKNIKGTVTQLVTYVVILLVLALASYNIRVYLDKQEVLGIEDTNTAPTVDDRAFWEKFMQEHPEYIPGWIELGRIDKVIEIDPNYFLHSGN